MKKIGLIDVDNIGKIAKFPNLALMKLSAYHKLIGDHVEMVNPLMPYDKVYMSKVFDYTPDFDTILNAKEIKYGGVAYGLENKLPYEIEHIKPDYSLYGIKNKAYGFITRGCPRNCDFCNVSQNQGLKSLKVNKLSEFWNGEKDIILLDPNIMACKDWKEVFQELIDSGSYVDFSQGLDIRLMTKEKLEYINKIKVRVVHFAWDNYEFETYEILKKYRPLITINRSKLVVYVLTNFNTTIEQDLDRIYKLKELDYMPYVMIYDKKNSSRKLKRIQRWVNNRFIWRTCETFEDYKG